MDADLFIVLRHVIADTFLNSVGRIKKMAKCYDGTMSDKEVMEILKLARNTYYKYKREIDAEM